MNIKGRKPILQIQTLELLAVCGCISKTILYLSQFHNQRIRSKLKQMVDMGEIRLAGQGENKRYTLLKPGKDRLIALNPARYTLSLFQDNNTLLRVPARSVMNGDTAAILSQAGFSVHPDDKPTLPAITPNFHDGSGWWMELYNNQIPYRYDADNPDCCRYLKRDTPVGCYYTSVEIKRHLRDRNDNGLRYSRACGVLFTPDRLFRVFHGRDVAFEYRQTGENKLVTLLPKLFGGYLPEQKNGVLIVGNGFDSAEKILAGDFDKARIEQAKREKRIFVNTRNLGNPLFYFPVSPDSLTLLRLMNYPGWADSIAEYAAKQVCEDFTERSGIFFADCGDGTRFYSGLELNLTKLAGLVRAIRASPGLPVSMACLHWQKQFYTDILGRYAGENANGVRLFTFDNEDIQSISEQLNDYWEA